MEFLDAETQEQVKEAIEEERIKWLGDYGFVTWLEKVRDGRLWIYINNLYTLPEYRSFSNMRKCYKELERFLRNKYPDAIGYWHREKGNRFHYV